MSVHYFAMVRVPVRCSECRGQGRINGFSCVACQGSGEGSERFVLHRDGKLYDEPGKASGSARRAGLDPVVYKVDTDECEPVDRRMSLDEKIGHAEAKYIFWGGRLDELRARAAGRPTMHKHDPKLTAEDYAALLAVLKVSTKRVGHVAFDVADGAHMRALLDKLTLKVHLDERDAEHRLAWIEIDRMHDEWAAGKSGRKCLRVGDVNVYDGTARTACDSTVPGPASTTNHAEVACCGCERAIAARGTGQ